MNIYLCVEGYYSFKPVFEFFIFICTHVFLFPSLSDKIQSKQFKIYILEHAHFDSIALVKLKIN